MKMALVSGLDQTNIEASIITNVTARTPSYKSTIKELQPLNPKPYSD